MDIQWTLTSGSIITVQLNYAVLQKNHRIMFSFLVTTNGKINPLTLITFFRDIFLTQVFIDVCSQEFGSRRSREQHIWRDKENSQKMQTTLQIH